MTKAQITALLVALVGVGYAGTIALNTDFDCVLVDVVIPIEGDVAWCGSDQEATDHKIELIDNLDDYGKGDLVIYEGWVENDAGFYEALKAPLLLKIDDPEYVKLHSAVVRLKTNYREELEVIFAGKYSVDNNEFSGELIYEQPILRQIAADKFQQLKGDNRTFDWFSFTCTVTTTGLPCLSDCSPRGRRYPEW